MMRTLRFISIGLSLLFFVQISVAHNRSESFSEWALKSDGTVSVTYSILSREVSALPEAQGQTSQQQLGKLLIDHYKKTVIPQSGPNNQACELEQEPQLLSAKSGYLRLEAAYHCPSTDNTIDLSITSFLTVSKNHTHYAMVNKYSQQLADSDSLTYTNKSEYLFTANQTLNNISFLHDATIPSDQGLLYSSLNHIFLGFEHIVFGFDHLLFLLGILLVAKSTRELLWMVTGFTLGHSISLILTVLGYASPNIVLVEAFIAFSILVMATESILTKNNKKVVFLGLACITLIAIIMNNLSDLSISLSVGLIFMLIFSISYLLLNQSSSHVSYKTKAMLTAMFGIIHGFGFASSFLSMDYQADNLIWKLISFNIGVELGQILILSLTLFLGLYFKKFFHLKYQQALVKLSLVLLTTSSVFWFLQRTL